MGDKNPFAINRKRLEEAIISGFPASYLTSLSIIQGVVFGALIFYAKDAVGQPVQFSIVLLGIISFCNLIIVWSEYSWFTRQYLFLPLFIDAAMPFMIGAAEVIPMFFFESISDWAFAATALPLTGTLAWGNTLYHTTSNMFEHNQPDISERCHKLLRVRLKFVMCLMPFVSLVVVLIRLFFDQMTEIRLASIYCGIFLLTYACIIWSVSEMTDEVLNLYGIRSGNLNRPLHKFWHLLRWLSLESCVGSPRPPSEKGING